MLIRLFTVACIASVLAGGLVRVPAADMASGIDLTAFGVPGLRSASFDEDLPLKDVAWRDGRAPRRFYLSGMIGPSFANLSSAADPTLDGDSSLFAAGGALGIAFERPNGRLRLETEGMGRSMYIVPCPEPAPCATVLAGTWSVMENLWRDVMFTERFGAYGGGGIGAGGYAYGERFAGTILYDPAASNFAWQFGGGLLWELGDRLTFDVGYRYFQINTLGHPSVAPTLFTANELMFTLRLYEPFRGWRR
ncbi:MAG: outer membrane protein [Pirellulales bacterium]